MFKHEYFDVIEANELPLETEFFLMDEIYINEYEEYWVNNFKLYDSGNEAIQTNCPGYISWVSIERINPDTIELILYAGSFDRYHSLKVILPKDQIVISVANNIYSEKIHVFVKSRWLEHLHTKYNSIFMMIDAIGIKDAIKHGRIDNSKLMDLRSNIDELSDRYENVTFVSFADSLLLKSNWTVGYFKRGVKYDYNPEIFFTIFKELKDIFNEHLQVTIYGILTQGENEYYDEKGLHISNKKNHVCLNSLGSPFSDLQKIDEEVRKLIKSKVHTPYELYIDEDFYYSIQFKFGFDKQLTPKFPFISRITGNTKHYCCEEYRNVFENLRNI